MAGVIIVGAGQAGLQVAASLRDFGYAEPIKLIGREAYAPYQRPPLSKSFIKSDAEPNTLALRAEAFFANADIDLELGTEVVGLDPKHQLLTTADGGRHAFDKLVLAVGTQPRALQVPGAGLDGVLSLRDIKDALSLRQRLATALNVVVIGGGFIGLEVAATAAAAGCTVTVVEAAQRIMMRAVSPEISRFFEMMHRSRGVAFRLNAGVARIDEHGGRVVAVTLLDGERIPADIVLIGIGIETDRRLPAMAGLRSGNGIAVDIQGRTDHAAIFAAGDCTLHPHPSGNGALIGLESVQNAIEQGKAVAGAIVGHASRHDALPWFWSDQAEFKLQIAGLAVGTDDAVLRGDPHSGRFSVLRFRSGRLVAVESVNHGADHLAARKLIAANCTIGKEALSDCTTPLKSLIAGEAMA
jgi:3-phenylpropionate/trans-cinnamate dioxygenase ferredoxin reductase subunit